MGGRIQYPIWEVTYSYKPFRNLLIGVATRKSLTTALMMPLQQEQRSPVLKRKNHMLIDNMWIPKKKMHKKQ